MRKGMAGPGTARGCIRLPDPYYPGPWSPQQARRRLRFRPSQRRRGDRPSNHSRQRDDRQNVRDHLYELGRDHVVALQMDLHGLRSREQQTCCACAQRAPSPEYHGRNGDESSARGHLIGELVLVERQIYAAQRGKREGG